MKIHSMKSKAARLFAALGLLSSSFVLSDVHADSGILSVFDSPRANSALAPKSLLHNNQEFRVVNAAGYEAFADEDVVATVGHLPSMDPTNTIMQTSAGCSTCGTSCGGACGGGVYGGDCSTGNCGGPMGVYGHQLSYGTGKLCRPCEPYVYASVEALYMNLDSADRTSFSQNFSLGDFDQEWAPRVTIGSVPDCVHGWEGSFAGKLQWDINASLNSAGGGINTLLIPGLPVAATSLSTFNNAVFQSQSYRAEYWTAELNKTLVGWEVAKLLIGGRYIDYDELYNYNTRIAGGQTGLLSSNAENKLYGLQIGMDMLFPVSCHGYIGLRGRAGGYVNNAETNVFLNNAGSTVLNNVADDTELAGVFELGAGYRYDLGEMLSVRAGFEMWYIDGLATAPKQIDQVVRPTMARGVRMDEDIFITGFTLGAQLKF